MLIALGIIIIIISLMFYKDYKDYQEVKPQMKASHDRVIEEGKELKRKAEEEMKKEKCSEGGKCNFVLKKKTKEYIYPYGDQITGHYKCTKCGDTRDEIIQYCN